MTWDSSIDSARCAIGFALEREFSLEGARGPIGENEANFVSS